MTTWEEKARERRRAERADRAARRPSDEQVLSALAGLMPADGRDRWVNAFTVSQRLNRDGFYTTPGGLGRRLTALARAGRCEISYGFLNYYRPRSDA